MRNLLDPPDGYTLASILQGELERNARVESGLSLAFVDVDEFTRFNAVYGWNRGTEVLEAIVTALAAIPGCSAGSIGGDAFAVVIGGMAASEAREAMRRKSQVIAQIARVCVSIGGVTTRRRCTVRAMMRAAHDQLMAAKRAGGDRVVWMVEPSF
jgi:diguanylate cyclase (GGDEF)-like protein